MTGLSIFQSTAQVSNKDVFANLWGLQESSFSATILVSAMTEATHYPNGFVAPGTLLGRLDSGAGVDEGLWVPYVNDGANGAQTVAGIVWDGFYVGGPYPGSYTETETFGAILLPKTPVYLYEAKMPGLLLVDGTTAFAPVAATIASTNFSFVDLGSAA